MVSTNQPSLLPIQEIFQSSAFRVPDYQRSYAWGERQWDDLWEDIKEGRLTETSHYFGTIVLMRAEEQEDSVGNPVHVFDVVDGQQRLTTLCLLLIAVYRHLRSGTTDQSRNRAHGLWTTFIEPEEGLRRLTLGSLNDDYFGSLVAAVRDGASLPYSDRSTNERLRNAVVHFEDHLRSFPEGANQEEVLHSLQQYIRRSLNALQFITDSRALAIKTFQTVNDRGKDLSLLEKTKSFLMFYVTRYLGEDEEILNTIEKIFGEVFDYYDGAVEVANELGIDYLVNSRYRFSENELLRYAYHYGARDLNERYSVLRRGYVYDITPEQVFNHFLKEACRYLQHDSDLFRSFVEDWCDDLKKTSEALYSLLRRVYCGEESLVRLFLFQEPVASVYPLLVATQARGLLTESWVYVISVLDLRVYQIRGTDPRADLYRNAVSMIKIGDPGTIYQAMIDYCRHFGNNRVIDGYLRAPAYKQSYTKYILWEYAVKDCEEQKSPDHSLYSKCHVEHILPNDPDKVDVKSFGFSGVEEYDSMKDTFGNLALLESDLNKVASNSSPSHKAEVYKKSAFTSNRVFGERIKAEGFTRRDQETRLEEVVDFVKGRWPIPARE